VTLTTASLGLLLAGKKSNRLNWTASMLGITEAEAVRHVKCWDMNREVKRYAERLEPQIRRCA
jgi:hypothetical protein